MAYANTTRAQLRSALQTRVDSVPWWTTTDANDAINEALYWFNLYTGYWRGSASVLTVAGTPFISLGSSLTKGARVYRAGRVLTRKSIVELYRQRRNWRTQTTASGSGVPTVISEWAPVGLAQIAIWPRDAGGTTLTVEGVKLTPILTADGSFIDLGEEMLDALVGEMLWILAFKRPSQLERLRDHHTGFLQACLDRNDQLRASSTFRKWLGLDQQQRIAPTRLSLETEA